MGNVMLPFAVTVYAAFLSSRDADGSRAYSHPTYFVSAYDNKNNTLDMSVTYRGRLVTLMLMSTFVK